MFAIDVHELHLSYPLTRRRVLYCLTRVYDKVTINRTVNCLCCTCISCNIYVDQISLMKERHTLLAYYPQYRTHERISFTPGRTVLTVVNSGLLDH